MTRTIKLLGSLAISENGRSSLLQKNAKGCALLTYLIVTQKAHSREHIADLLWEARSTAQSLRNLRVMLTRIRPLLPELRISRHELALYLEPETKIDFLSLSKAVETSEADQLEAGLALYEGPLLAGFHIKDAPRFNEWLLLERERLQHRVIEAYRHSCTLFADEQAWERGLNVARRWLLLDDLDERAHRKCIEFLAAMGKQTAALQQYETCRQRLWQELDVEPTAATTALAKKVRSMGETAVSPPIFETPDLSQLVLDELPDPGPLPQNAVVAFRRNDDFTGREKDLLAIASKLLTPATSSPPVVAVTGMGGLGKTQLAVEFCYRYGRYFPGGVFWMSFADADNVTEEVMVIGGERGMGLYQTSDKLSQADQVGRIRKAWQEPIPRLLIFDNCEEEALLSEWMPVTGGCRVLLTSRRANWSRELDVCERPLQTLKPPESLTLLQQLAPKLSADEAAAIAAELGHLPLALHLAGSFLERYPQIAAAQYLWQLRDRGTLAHPSLHGRGTSYSPTGHELNVFRTFAINLEKLVSNKETDAMAQNLLRCAAYFAPGEPIPINLLCTTVLDNDEELMAMLLAEDGIQRLIGLGFLTATNQAVVMHRLISTFAIQSLHDTSTQISVENTLITFIRDNKMQGVYTFAKLPISSTHLHHVMEQAAPRRDLHSARLINLWGKHLRDVGQLAKAVNLFLQAYEILVQCVGEIDPESVQSLLHIGNSYVRLSAYRHAYPYLEQYLQSCEQLEPPDFPLIARAADNLGTLNIALGNYVQANAYLERALELRIHHLGSDHLYIGNSLINLCALKIKTGDYEKGRELAARALEIKIKRVGENHPNTAMALDNLADCYLGLGNLEQAEAFAQKSLTVCESTLGSQHLQTAFGFNTLGLIKMAQGEYEAASKWLSRSLKIRQKTVGEAHRSTGFSYHFLGQLLLKINKMEEAGQKITRALEIMEKVLGVEHPLVADILVSMGAFYQQTGDNEKAVSSLETALLILNQHVLPTHTSLQRAQMLMALLATDFVPGPAC